MSRLVRRRGPGPPAFDLLLVAAASFALVVAVSGCRQPSQPSGAIAQGRAGGAGSAFTLMQMNLCLSGLAGCYGKVAYPAGVEEAVRRIREVRPDAVTVNEACRGDVARIGRDTGYRVRFSRVVYRRERLRCVRPGGRGLFGDAVLTKARVKSSHAEDFVAQEGIERRRWLCVSTRGGVDVCTAHLNTRSSVEIAGNDAQCAELGAVLAGRDARAVIFGGDVNRRDSCAPAGAWTRTDEGARQAPGLQHVYGSGALKPLSAEVVPAAHTDHDVLIVRARR